VIYRAATSREIRVGLGSGSAGAACGCDKTEEG